MLCRHLTRWNMDQLIPLNPLVSVLCFCLWTITNVIAKDSALVQLSEAEDSWICKLSCVSRCMWQMYAAMLSIFSTTIDCRLIHLLEKLLHQHESFKRASTISKALWFNRYIQDFHNPTIYIIIWFYMNQKVLAWFCVTNMSMSRTGPTLNTHQPGSFTSTKSTDELGDFRGDGCVTGKFL